MVFQIIWSPLALRSYINNIKYLEEVWRKKEVNNFITAAEKKLNLLKKFPQIGFPSKQNKYLRKTL